MDNTPGIYIIANDVDGKFYVGSAKRLQKRKTEHLRDLKSGFHHNVFLQRAFLKHGADNFSFIIIENQMDVQDLVNFEQLYLDEYYGKDCCYNANPNAKNMLGFRHSSTTKQKMSDSRKKSNNGMWGKHLSEDAKNQLSKAKKGKKMSEETRIKMSNSRLGEKHPNCKTTPSQVKEIRLRFKSGESIKSIAKDNFSIKECSIRDIIGRRSWKHL